MAALDREVGTVALEVVYDYDLRLIWAPAAHPHVGPLRKPGVAPKVDDVATALARLSALFDAVNDAVGLAEEDPTTRLPPPRGEVYSIRRESPLEVITSIPTEYYAGGGGLAALLVFAERIFTFPMRVSAEWSRLRLEKDKFEHERAALQTTAWLPGPGLSRANAPRVGEPADNYGATQAKLVDIETGHVIAEGELDPESH